MKFASPHLFWVKWVCWQWHLMPVCRILFQQPIKSSSGNPSNPVKKTVPNSSPSWLPCYIHLLPYLPLWLRIYCFKLNFKTIVQLNIPNFEKSILEASRYEIPILSCCLLPFSFGHALSLFYPIFNYFHDFLDFQQAWINFMIPNNGIHGTNSCEIN